jgi:putative transposase
VRRALAPAGEQGPIQGLVLDLTRSRRELLIENAFLRHQPLVAARQTRRPDLRAADRLVLVGLAAMFAHWRNALVLVQPGTLLRWHRDLFRRLWAVRSKPKTRRKSSRELLKIGIEVVKSTIQHYISRFPSTPPGQRWSTFLRSQAAGIWCCDLFDVRDLWFRCHFVFVVMHLESRRVLRAVTSNFGS